MSQPTYIVGFLRNDHFSGHCVDRQVHHDLHWEGILRVDRQRSESYLRQNAIIICCYHVFIYRWTIDLHTDASGSQHLCHGFTLWQIHCMCRYFRIVFFFFFVQVNNPLSKQDLPLMLKSGRWSLRVTTLIRCVMDLVIFAWYAIRAFSILLGSESDGVERSSCFCAIVQLLWRLSQV